MKLKMEGLELEPSSRQDFLSAEWLSVSNQGWGLSPSCWSWHPEAWAQAGPVPFQSVFPSVCTGTFGLEWGSAEVSGARHPFSAHIVCRRRSQLALTYCLRRHLRLFPFFGSDTTWCAIPLCPSQHVTVLSLHHSHPFVEPHHWATWTLGTWLRISCGGAAAVRDLRATWDVLLE